MTTDVDYSQPLATLLRATVMEIHDSVANSRGAKALGEGKLPKQEYVRLLMMLWHIYSALEQALDQHASYPGLEATYNPAVLARTQAISSDISHLLQVPEDAWQHHPIHVSLTTNTPPALSAYLDRIHQLAGASTTPFQNSDNQNKENMMAINDVSPLDPDSAITSSRTSKRAQCQPHVALLLSHAYARYLGDLSGGQTIRYTLGKAYGLDLDSASSCGPGVTFYEFKELYSSGIANQGELKRIKEWFKEGMNDAGEKIGPMGKRAIILEAKETFQLNADLLECLNLPESEPPKPDSYSKSLTVNESRCRSALKSIVASKHTHVLLLLLALCAAHFAW
ncbi:hypothetical protein AX14_001243 [Amanita brunnescens Koide BX004]|nr:hypothetical protein AX14_001243 [Amanita brunnescens Koide BX004]